MTRNFLAVISMLGLTALSAQAQSPQNTALQAPYTSYVGSTPAGTVAAGQPSNYVKTRFDTTTQMTYTADSFLDAEAPGSSGNTNDAFSLFGLIDYANPVVFNAPVASVQNVQLVLTESHYRFSAPGLANVYLATDTATKDYYDANSPSPLQYQAAQDAINPSGVGTQLGTAYFLGSAQFANTQTTPSPTVPAVLDTFNLDLSDPTASALFLAQLNSGGNIRLIITPDVSVDGAATTTSLAYYGAFVNATNKANNINTAPILKFDAFDATGNPNPGTVPLAAPEPGSVLTLLLGMGMVGGAITRRRLRAS